MSPLLARLNRVWRGAMTGVCFALFGLGGLLLSLIWFNLLLIVIRNKPRRRRLARRSIAASFRLFWRWSEPSACWITALKAVTFYAGARVSGGGQPSQPDRLRDAGVDHAGDRLHGKAAC